MAKVSEIRRLLLKDGWYLHRHGGNHDMYRHKEKSGQITLPRHGSKELATGTMNSILKQAGLK
ncbi:type II toxin-antitoxin system HicA family toxin [Robertkochia marina]|uniref:Type II toxin-antitoxin system HicA family toxin n=1 Tax=Robertkochia marina TaxID=1227945 RepID=A0A4S3M2D3_9FLAO|nr:type II toxin-antitoxin system HicA family toxin [Robertkochia marina]THD67635.1 type II toxin-antitoxin system HicA family toxin [Robertkochia marina]TRZ43368.1 type II toxin-antitoxin system HicA family toxin [Robertkochia marina]